MLTKTRMLLLLGIAFLAGYVATTVMAVTTEAGARSVRSHEIDNLQLKYVWPEYGFTYEITNPTDRPAHPSHPSHPTQPSPSAHDELPMLRKALSVALFEVDSVAEQAPDLAEAPFTASAPAPRAYRKYQMLSWTVGSGKQRHYLWILDDGTLYDPHSDHWLQNEALALAIAKINVSAQARFFGKPLTWPEVVTFFPVGGVATVRDLESGLEFRVRRHRGDSHADVEPLSAKDTAVLKKIYGGSWSWARRAVVVDFGENRKVAGSMNGMPHGWGDLEQNEFVGHFCIHFKDSRVHTTWRQDPGHQLMVLKSSGALANALVNARPDRLVYWVLAAVHQREKCTLRYATDGLPLAVLMKLIQPIRHLAAINCRTISETEERAVVEASLMLYYYLPDPQKAHPVKIQFELHKNARESQPGWRLSAFQLKGLLTAGSI